MVFDTYVKFDTENQESIK